MATNLGSPIPAATPKYKTYQQRFADPGNDPFAGDYQALMKLFSTKIHSKRSEKQAGAITKKVFATAGVQPHAFLHLSLLDSKPTILILHRPITLVKPMGQDGPDNYLILLGDQRGRSPPATVYFPEEAFQQARNVRVATPEMITRAFADPAVTKLGPFAAGDLGTELVSVTNMMYLPPRYVPDALAAPFLTPRQAWEVIGAPIVNDPNPSLTSDLAPLLEWLQVALVIDPSEDPPVAVTLDPPSYPFPLTPSIRDAVEQCLDLDLPGLVTEVHPDTGTVTAINNLTSEIIEQGVAAANRAAESTMKTPARYFGQGTLLLNRVTQTGTPNDLPLLYHDLAGSNKKTERLVIEECFCSVADDLGLLDYTPLTTPSLAKKLTTCTFAHNDLSNLSAGIQPFITTYRDPVARTLLETSMQAYDDVLQGAGTALADLNQLRAAEKTGIPSNIIQVTYCFKSFKVLLHALLGSFHPLTRQFDELLQHWTTSEIILDAAVTTPDTAGQIVRWVQLRVSNWFNDQVRSPSPVPAPNLARLLSLIRHNEAWVVPLPPQYSRLKAPPPALYPATTHTTHQQVMSLPPATTAGNNKATQPSNGRGERCNNANYQSDYSSFKELGLPVRDVRDKAKAAGKPVPANDQGTEMCLSYHILGFCWNNCGKSGNHHNILRPGCTNSPGELDPSLRRRGSRRWGCTG